MNVVSAEFAFSSGKVSQIPPHELPEFAFIGRSNVGKSSLINMLTGRNTLAKVSGTPGKTRLINHFLVNGAWYLVDLPGYGYAKTSKSDRRTFSRIITDYVAGSPKLHFLFVLIDSRLEPQRIDLDFLLFLGREGIPFGIVFTKADKQSAARTARNAERFGKELSEFWEELPPMYITSAEKKQGREEILDFIDGCLKNC